MGLMESALIDYKKEHSNSNNQFCHYIGVPTIVFSILGMLQYLNIANFPLNLSLVAITIFTILYAQAYKRWSIMFLVISLIFYFVASAFSLMTHVMLFVIGWIFQLVGHYIFEKNSPSFYKNFVHLYVGPLWLIAKLDQAFFGDSKKLS